MNYRPVLNDIEQRVKSGETFKSDYFFDKWINNYQLPEKAQQPVKEYLEDLCAARRRVERVKTTAKENLDLVILKAQVKTVGIFAGIGATAGAVAGYAMARQYGDSFIETAGAITIGTMMGSISGAPILIFLREIIQELYKRSLDKRLQQLDKHFDNKCATLKYKTEQQISQL